MGKTLLFILGVIFFDPGIIRMLNDYLITVDVDWAPNSAISNTTHYLIENKIKAS
jgi:hypothetical protein